MTTTTSTTPTLRDVDGMAVIGRTKHQLMGIRYGEGEGGDGDDAAAQAAAAVASATPAEGAAAAAAETVDQLPDWAQRVIRDTRAENADQRTKANELATKFDNLTKGLAGALGLGEQPETDPVKLAAQVTDLSGQVAAKDTDLTKAQADVKAGQLSTAVAILAHGLGGNAKLLLANDQFKTSIASVDPADEAAITAKITAAIQANAALKAPPARSGSGEHQGATVQGLEAQLAAAEKSGDVALSITLKRRIAAAKTS